MKQVFILLFIGISILNARGQTQYKVVPMGFYNLENLYDTIDQPDVDDAEFTPDGNHHYTGTIFKDKIEHLVEVLSQIGTDLSPDGLAFFGCAEIENTSVLETLASHPKLLSRNYQIVHYDGPDLRGVDCGFMYNPKYFRVTDSRSIRVDLSQVISDWRPTRDILYVKGLLNGTDTIHIFVNHWPSRRGSSEATAPLREFAAGICRKQIDSLMAIDPNTKVILMGDLNDNPTDPSMVKVLSCSEKRETTQPGGLYNPWVEFYKKGIGTLGFNDTWSLFDQIVFSYGWLNKEQSGYFLKSAHIFNRDFMVQKTGKYKGYPKRTWDWNLYNAGYSDHFPTYVYLLKKIQ